MSYKSIANPAISVDEAQELDRSNAQTFNSAHHNGKVGLGSKLLATLPTETEKTLLPYLPTAILPAPAGNAGKTLKVNSAGDGYEATAGDLTDGEFVNQVLAWNGSSWAPWGFKDTFPGSGDETALNARWTPDTPDTGAGESIAVGSNALTVQTATAGSTVDIVGPDFDSLPFDLRFHVTTSGYTNTNDRIDLEIGGDYSTGIVLRFMYFSSQLQIFSVKKGTAFDTEAGAPTSCWLRVVGMEDGTVHTYFSSAAHTAEPSGLVGWTLLGSSTLATIADSRLVLSMSGVSHQTTTTIRNFKLSRPH